MRNIHYTWKGKIGCVSAGRIMARGYVLPAVHPFLWNKAVNLALYFEIGLLRGKHGYPVRMLGNLSFHTTGEQKLDLHADADWYFPAAVADPSGELNITKEFTQYIVSRCGVNRDWQDLYDDLVALGEQARKAGCDPNEDPEFQKMCKYFWDEEMRGAKTVQDKRDVDMVRKLVQF